MENHKHQGDHTRGRPESSIRPEFDSGAPPLNAAHEEMLHWLKTVRFRKTLFGGIEERDLWKKLEELNTLYEAALLAERTRYDTLLQERVILQEEAQHPANQN